MISSFVLHVAIFLQLTWLLQNPEAFGSGKRSYTLETSSSELNRLLSVRDLPTTTNCDSHLIINCWASCSVSSLCYGNGNTDGYIYCSWNPLHLNQSLRYTAYVSPGSSAHQFCNPHVVCQEEICHTYIFTNNSNCHFLTIEDLLTFSIKVKSVSDVYVCSATTKFKPCNIIRLDPPLLERIQQADGASFKLTVSPAHCARETWITPVYKLMYTTFNGMTIYGKEQPNLMSTYSSFTLPFKEANEYNFTVVSAIEEVPKILKVWSQPACTQYLTEPTTAADHSYIDFMCLQYESGYSFLARWQKTGLVDMFNISITDTNTNNSIYILKSVNKHDKIHEVTLHNLTHGRDYLVKLIAVNTKGRSAPLQRILNDTICDRKAKQPTNCAVLSKGETWMTIQWVAPRSTSYTTFQVETKSKYHPDERVTLDMYSDHYNVTGLQPCTQYTQVVYVLQESLELGSCSFKSYTQDKAPVAAPVLQVKNISYSSLVVQVIPVNESVICGTNLFYNISIITDYEGLAPIARYVKVKAPLHAKSIKINHLKPNTKYSIQVARANKAGMGSFSVSQVFQTLETAPSTPPRLNKVEHLGYQRYLVHWTPPLETNGKISCYQMMIDIPSQQVKWKSSYVDMKCNQTNNLTICYMNSTWKNVTLELSSGTKLQIRACTGQGKLCSGWSTAAYAQSQDMIPIAVMAITASLVSLLVITCLLYVIYTRYCKGDIKEPVIQPGVFESPDILQFNKNTDKTSAEFYATKSCVKEEYESVSVWRNDNKHVGIGVHDETSNLQLKNAPKIHVACEETTESTYVQGCSETSSADETNIEMPSFQETPAYEQKNASDSDEREFEFDSYQHSGISEVSRHNIKTENYAYIMHTNFSNGDTGDSGMGSSFNNSNSLTELADHKGQAVNIGTFAVNTAHNIEGYESKQQQTSKKDYERESVI